MMFKIIVSIDCDSAEDADTVACERLGYDEDYGFPYEITSFHVAPDDD